MAEFDPCDIIGEVLGEPAELARDLASSEQICPYMGSRCIKRSHRVQGSFPVCSVYKGARSIENLVAVCPKRFIDSGFVSDVLEHCWTSPSPAWVELVHEIKLGKFGMVDAVVASMNEQRTEVLDFVSVELQAVDITGSYEPAYTSLLQGLPLGKRPTYGFNWANVRKRYITQLVSKGFYHQQWGTRIASVLQDHVFDYFQRQLRFDELPPIKSDIVFLVYKYKRVLENGVEAYRLVLDKAVGTSHSSLMMQALYSQTPPRDDFCNRIVDRFRG